MTTIIYPEHTCERCGSKFRRRFPRVPLCCKCQRREERIRNRSRYTRKLDHFSLYDKRAACPICSGDFKDVHHSWMVCEAHQDWLVTTCKVCSVVSFSDGKGYCTAHGPADVPIWRGGMMYGGVQ